MTTVMGVDLGISKIAYALWEDDVLLGTEAYESRNTTRMLQLLDCADFLVEAIHHTKPDYVVIEDTLIGNNRAYSIKLSQMMGACLSGIGALSLEQLVEVVLVNNKTWKKEVLGNGNAGKKDVMNYIDVTHSAYAELCGRDQDRYDAACIGLYGQRLHATATALLEDLRRVPG